MCLAVSEIIPYTSDTQIWLLRSTFQEFSSNPDQTHLPVIF